MKTRPKARATLFGTWFADRGIGVKAAMLLLAVMGLFVFSSSMFLLGQQQVREEQRLSDHSYAVLDATARLEGYIADQTADLRGYELTREPDYRASFIRNGLAFDAQLSTLLRLTRDNPEQQVRLRRIADQIQQWRLNYTDPALRMAADPARRDELQRFIRARPGRPYRLAIRTEIDAIDTGEGALLKQRNARLATTLERVRWLSIITLLGGMLATLYALRAVHRYLTEPIGALQRIVERQTQGELAEEVPHQDRGDELGSMARAIEGFRLASLEARRREWIKTEISTLSRMLAHPADDAGFGNTTLAHLCPRVGAGFAVLYRVENELPRPIASYGLGLEQLHGRGGLAAQCARDRQPLMLDELPADYLRIQSGLGAAAPRHLLLLPLSGAQGVVGVLELASFGLIDAAARDMLDEAARLLGLAMEALGSAIRTQELLEESRVQAEELQASEESLRVQAEELRTTNEALADKGRALNEFNEKLVAFQAELERKNRDLENASRYKSEFLANMSHELRTPLNSLLILARDLADNGDGNLSAEQVESAQIILDSGSNLLRLINDILDLSKIEAGRMDVHWESVDLAALATSLERQFRRSASQKSLNFSIDIAAGTPAQFVSDPAKLTQILVNLIGNALKFTAHGAVSLRIEALPADDTRPAQLLFHVQDSGIGIDAEQIARLFEPFEQADGSTSRRYGGTGLGLSISRAFARMLGGEISVRSSEGQGSCFTLQLPEPASTAPAATAPVSPSTASAVPPPLPRTASQHGGTPPALVAGNGEPTILIAEDDPAFARVLADIARRKGYQALLAGDGRTALQLAQQHQPRGILLDVGLPGLDGWQVLDQLKADPLLRSIPVHFITATDEAARGLAAGAVGFLTKPATREALDAAFARVINGGDGRRRRLLVVDDEPVARAAISKLLAGQAVDIVEAETAAAAQQQLASARFDCMILDLTLPDASGLELLEQLSAHGPLPPIVIYSARELSRDEHARLREYTDSIVIKGAQTPDRLLDEVTLFLHAVRQPQAASRTGSELNGRCVLLVDDDMRNVFALSKALRHHGLKVLVAQDGYKALTQLEQHDDIECVLMDVMMPGMDGYDTTREIRRHAQWQTLPIIAVTAKAMHGDREKCLEAGASDYLTKPIDIDKLLSMLRAWLPQA